MKNSIAININPFLEKTINNLGYKNISQFAAQQVKLLLLGKTEELKNNIKFYEIKYHINYKKFDKKFLSKPNCEDFEKEDDGMDWKFNIECLKAYERDLKELEKC